MARDLVPRTIELTRSQITNLTAIGHIERRSVSFLVREAVEGYIAAYQQAAIDATNVSSLVPPKDERLDLRVVNKMSKPPQDVGQWLMPSVNLMVPPPEDSLDAQKKSDEKSEPEHKK